MAEGGKAIAETAISAYNHSYARRDPFREALFHYSRNASPVGVFTDEDLLPNEGLLLTDLYQDLLGPSNLRHGIFTILALSVRRFDAISIWRSRDAGPMPTDSMRLLELLIPHVQTALEVRRVLGATQQRLASAEAMANASSTASFVLNRHGNIVHSNAAAQSLVRDADALTIVNGRLTACEPQASADLSKLLMEVTSPSFSMSNTESNRFIALRRTSSMRPLQAVATSLPETLRRSAGEILLLVTDPEKLFSFPDDALRALY